MTSFIDAVYNQCIAGGIYIADFWEMTVKEIMDYIKAREEEKKADRQLKAYIVYKESCLNAYAYHQPNKMPKIEEVFEGIFEKREENKAQDWRIMKARMIEYSEMWRKKNLQK